MHLNPVTPELAEEFNRLAGGSPLQDTGRYGEDPRGLIGRQDAVVVAPSSVSGVAAVIRRCNELSIAVIPHGGGTGLVGGQLPQGLPTPLVLSLGRLAAIRQVSLEENLVTAEAGCILADVHAETESLGRQFPLSLAARGSCQIGGNLATNAGGVHVLRYGNARDLCVGLEVVLPDGRIWDGLSSLRKDNAGYDLRNLFIGSEGTLGVITAARLKLFRQPVDCATALLAIPSPAAAISLLGLLQDQFESFISAFELISRVGFDFLEQQQGWFNWPIPSRPDWMVLVELSSDIEIGAADRLADAAADAAGRSLVTDGAFPANEAQRLNLWRMREAIPEANRKVGSVSSHDLSVPTGSIARFIEEAGDEVAALGDFRINCFGHVGDGNLHFNVFPPAGGRANAAIGREQVKDAVHRGGRRLGGSVFAEHGIGRLYVGEFMEHADTVLISMMQEVKQALDPAGIMNPGAALPMRAAAS